ncbi:hypothetical protein BREVNS_0317 [Brevinematales bacterium NS]|nr:hypothetical protein BREVNS_0317 [Brevinematales bacterium NS]
MSHFLWISLLCGLTSVFTGSLLSLGITNPEALMPALWIGCLTQSAFMGFRIHHRIRWITITKILLAFPFSLLITWAGTSLLKISPLSFSALVWLLGFSWVVMLLFWWAFSRKPRMFFHLLTGQPPESSLSYEKWAAEEIAKLNLNTSLDSTERLFFWMLLLSLLVSSIAILVHPKMQFSLTIGWLALFVGFWGTRAFLHEQAEIFGWRMQGLSLEQAKRTIPHGLVVLLLALCLGIGYLLPHRFVLISLESLGVKFRESVKQTEIELQNQQETPSTVPSEESTPSSRPSSGSSPSPLFLWGGRVLFSLFLLYLAVGLTGLFFERFWSYKPKNAFIRWLIRFYERNKSFFQVIEFLLTLLWTVLSTISGIALLQKALAKRKEARTENEALRQQLYALFENAETTSDEKKEEIMTIVKYFVMLIETASSRILPYRPSYGPLEYIEKLTQNIPSLRESLLWIVSVFNESRYSLHLLSQEKRSTFTQTVETVIAEMNK